MRIVTRAEWGAEPPTKPSIPMRLPVGALYLHHSVTPVTNDAAADTRKIQGVAFGRGFNDISYSWLVHPSGLVVEGRGFAIGAHTAGRNSSSFGVCLIGDYSRRVVREPQVVAIRELVAWLIARRALHQGTYPTAGHRDVAKTVCPGDFAMRRLPEMRLPWIHRLAPEVNMQYDPPLILEPIVADLPAPNGGLWLLGRSGAIYALGGAPYYGGPNGKPYWGDRQAARLSPVADRYAVIDSTGASYGPGF